MRLLKRVGDLLDTADEKATEANLETLTRHVGDAFGTNEAGGIKLDLGIVEGLADLKHQIGTDFKEKGLGVLHEGGADDTQARLALLKERVEELHAKEAERAEQSSRLQANLLEVESAIKEQKLEVQVTATATQQPVQSSRLEDLRREFREREAQSLQRTALLAAASTQAAATNEHLSQQLQFWQGKAEKMLAALGLEAVPKDVAHAIEHLESDQEHTEESEDKAKDVFTSNGSVQKEQADEQRAVQDLEGMLAELMRRSEEIMGRVEQQRHQERDLISQLSHAQEMAASEAKAAADCQEALQRAKAVEAHPRASAQASAARMNEVTQLRAEVESLRVRLESSRKECSKLEAQLGKHRAAAAADLERAVPSSAMSCWTWLDVPLMRLVMLLVKSTCLRRSFALHLFATYSWLFFLVFWLEKHP
ncbi:unnamed protein product [Symbiodinium natans]|uniref:Uncharacterized protein n=1 Tax=Symbiodinium natans TaxID=878477 RepID=A0A812I125_9DINO|nr:unnamed protein product [Symbiodinium natans]